MNWYDVVITGHNRNDISALVVHFLEQMGYEKTKT
jgi:hypothetical protein